MEASQHLFAFSPLSFPTTRFLFSLYPYQLACSFSKLKILLSFLLWVQLMLETFKVPTAADGCRNNKNKNPSSFPLWDDQFICKFLKNKNYYGFLHASNNDWMYIYFSYIF